MRAAAAFSVLLCSCALLGPGQPDYDYYVLTTLGIHDAGQHRSTATRRAAILAIEDVAIPSYLDREAIAIRAGENRLIYSDRARWAEPLDVGIERVLRQELARRLAPAGVSVSANRLSATYLLAIEVQRFERHGSDVELWARWTLREEGSVVATGDERITVTVAAPTAAAATDGMSRAIAELARRVRVAVERRQRPGRRPSR